MSINISAELVKQLRDATGVSVMQCRNALQEAEGDMDKAMIILKSKSSAAAMKKSDRVANDGTIVVKALEGKAVILALKSETDFVARNSEFVDLANLLADMALKEGVEAMKEKSTSMINELVQKIGEKIELGSVLVVSGSTLGTYVHNGKSGVAVALEGGDEALARDVAMHIAAMKPAYKDASEISAKDRARVAEVFQKEVAESDKPEEIKKKILDGKINTYFKEQTLMDQAFIKNPDMSIEKLLSSRGARLTSFSRESIN